MKLDDFSLSGEKVQNMPNRNYLEKELISSLTVYYHHSGKWFLKEVSSDSGAALIGKSSGADLKISQDDADDVQGIIRFLSSKWFFFERGTQLIAKVNGVRNRTLELSYDNSYVIEYGNDAFIINLDEDPEAENPITAQTELDRPEFQIEFNGKDYFFSISKNVLIGSNPICDLRTDGEPFEAMISSFQNVCYATPILGAPFKVNGLSIQEKCVLNEGSIMQFGDSLMKLSSAPKQNSALKILSIPNIMTNRLCLIELNKGRYFGDLHSLGKPGKSVFAGRASSNDIVLKSAKVSKKHVQMQINKDSVFVLDCGTRNGTYLEGNRILQSVALPGDVINIANVRFLLTYF